MLDIQNSKPYVGLAPISLNSAGATALTCDTLNYSYAAVVISFGVIGGACTVFKAQESASDFSGADITLLVGAGTTGVNRLPQTGDAGKQFMYGFPLGGTRKRYLQWQITTGATTLVQVTWFLFRGTQSPNTDTERNVAASLFL